MAGRDERYSPRWWWLGDASSIHTCIPSQDTGDGLVGPWASLFVPFPLFTMTFLFNWPAGDGLQNLALGLARAQDLFLKLWQQSLRQKQSKTFQPSGHWILASHGNVATSCWSQGMHKFLKVIANIEAILKLLTSFARYSIHFWFGWPLCLEHDFLVIYQISLRHLSNLRKKIYKLVKWGRNSCKWVDHTEFKQAEKGQIFYIW